MLGCHGVFHILFSLGVGEGEAGAGQDVEAEAEVASAFDPVVVLLGQDGSDEAVRESRAGKMPTTSVLRRISRLSRSRGLLDQIWRQIALGNAVNPSTSARFSCRCATTLGSFLVRDSRTGRMGRQRNRRRAGHR